MKFPLTYYYDKHFEKRVPVNELGHPLVNWGETIPGKRKEMTLYIVNESRDGAVLRQPFTSDKSLKIEDYPARLFAKDMGTITFSLTPDINKIESHAATWGFEIVLSNG